MRTYNNFGFWNGDSKQESTVLLDLIYEWKERGNSEVTSGFGEKNINLEEKVTN